MAPSGWADARSRGPHFCAGYPCPPHTHSSHISVHMLEHAHVYAVQHRVEISDAAGQSTVHARTYICPRTHTRTLAPMDSRVHALTGPHAPPTCAPTQGAICRTEHSARGIHERLDGAALLGTARQRGSYKISFIKLGIYFMYAGTSAVAKAHNTYVTVCAHVTNQCLSLAYVAPAPMVRGTEVRIIDDHRLS